MLVALQNTIEALDRAIADEGKLAKLGAAGYAIKLNE